MDKEDVIYTYIGILLRHKKEQSNVILHKHTFFYKLFVYFTKKSVYMDYSSNCCMIKFFMQRLYKLLVMLNPSYIINCCQI